MKISSLMFWSVLVLSLFLFGCNKQEKENFQKNIPQKEIRRNFLETIDSVRLISFPSKMSWNKDEIISGEEVDYEIPKNKIIDNIILKKSDFEKIKDILKDKYEDGCIVADCYEPRHLLQFYKNNEIIANYEICLECGGHQNSKNLDFLPPFCVQKGEELKEIFKKIGLKNFGEGSPILVKLE